MNPTPTQPSENQREIENWLRSHTGLPPLPTQPSATHGGELSCYTCGQGPARCNCTNYMMGAPTPSATPRTDAAEPVIKTERGGWVRADFARTLETELAAAKCESITHKDLWGKVADELSEAMLELAAAKAECARLRFSVEGHLLKTIQQQTELAALRAEVERLTIACDKFSNDEIAQGDWKARAERAELKLKQLGQSYD